MKDDRKKRALTIPGRTKRKLGRLRETEKMRTLQCDRATLEHLAAGLELLDAIGAVVVKWGIVFNPTMKLEEPTAQKGV